MNYAPVVDPGRDQRELVERLKRIEAQLKELLQITDLLARNARASRDEP